MLRYTESHFGLSRTADGRLSADGGETAIRKNANREQLEADILVWMEKEEFTPEEVEALNELLER